MATKIAKISRPILTEVFPRKRLFKLLDTGRKRPVIWVSGPPGCGKTTLVSSYLDTRKLPCLWYQVDQGDADPATFFYYLGLAAKKAAPRKRKPLPLLTPEYLQGIPTFILRYFEELYHRLNPRQSPFKKKNAPSPPFDKGRSREDFAKEGKGGFILVFDNYHEVPADSSFHEVILNGLSAIPEGINVILISRSDPPPPFIRLRANRLLEFLGWDELRLTLEESEAIVRLRAGRKQAKDSTSLLHEAADGWAAGLVLMLESVERKVIEPQALGRLTPEEIIDYFGNELFEKTDKEIQDFLLQTAFLPKMTAKMADELTGLANASRTLDTLNRNNYFTEKRFHGEPVYQYHPLFREFLLSRAKETLSPEDQSMLLHRAATLLEDSGQTEEAVPLFRDAGRWDELVELIRKNAPLLLEQGRHRSLAEWLESLPKEILEDDPWLLYWMGECHYPYDLQMSRFYFEKALEKFKTKETGVGVFLAWSGIVYSIANDLNDFTPLDKWIAVLGELKQSSRPFPSKEVGLRAASAILIALDMRQPQHPEIEAWAERVLALSETCSNIPLKIRGYARLAYHWVQMGEFQRAMMAINSLRELARQRNVPPLMVVEANFQEAIYNRYAGFHEECIKAVSGGLEQSQTIGVYHDYNFFLIHGISSGLNAQDLATANDLLKKMSVSLNNARAWAKNYYYLLRAREALAQGNPGEAATYLKIAWKFAGQVGAPITLFISQLVKSHVMHQLNQQEEAAHHLGLASDMANLIGSKLYKFFVLLAEALFAFDRGEPATGWVSLKRAFAMGREGGYFYTYVDQPYGLAGLGQKALEAGIEVEYVQELIRRLKVIPEKPPFQLENWPWPLKVFTLGRFEIIKDGKPIRFSRKAQPKVLSMLKALIALGGRQVREDLIADMLWPESDGDVSHMSFVTTLHRLRKLLGHETVIQYREGRLTLDDRFCWLDIWAFEEILDQIDAQWKEGSAEGAIHLTEKAIKLYKGAFLTEEVEKPWIISPRERLKSKLLRIVNRLADHQRQIGEWEKAVECYLKGLELNDIVEEFYQNLMICYQRLDRRAEAMAVYHHCRKNLSSILGIEPSHKTETIYKSIIAKGK